MLRAGRLISGTDWTGKSKPISHVSRRQAHSQLIRKKMDQGIRGTNSNSMIVRWTWLWQGLCGLEEIVRVRGTKDGCEWKCHERTKGGNALMEGCSSRVKARTRRGRFVSFFAMPQMNTYLLIIFITIQGWSIGYIGFLGDASFAHAIYKHSEPLREVPSSSVDTSKGLVLFLQSISPSIKSCALLPWSISASDA